MLLTAALGGDAQMKKAGDWYCTVLSSPPSSASIDLIMSVPRLGVFRWMRSSQVNALAVLELIVVLDMAAASELGVTGRDCFIRRICQGKHQQG